MFLKISTLADGSDGSLVFKTDANSHLVLRVKAFWSTLEVSILSLDVIPVGCSCAVFTTSIQIQIFLFSSFLFDLFMLVISLKELKIFSSQSAKDFGGIFFLDDEKIGKSLLLSYTRLFTYTWAREHTRAGTNTHIRTYISYIYLYILYMSHLIHIKANKKSDCC